MDVKTLFDQFSQKRVLVLGDVMVDAYLHGSVTRLSPEAPVPIINLSKSEDRLGGAANVALNLLSLGAEALICSVIGQDAGAEKMRELLKKMKLDDRGVISSPTRKTTIKTRVIGNHQQMLRIDEEHTNALTTVEEELLLEKVRELLDEGVDAVILEDYNKGVLTPKVISGTIKMANERGVITAVDPKKENFLLYREVSLFKPNLKELKEGLKVDFNFTEAKESFEKAVQELEAILANKVSFVTLSEHGVYVKDGTNDEYIPAHVRNIADVSGAGDTVISVATLCLASGLDAVNAARIANLSGGLVCEMSGVVPIDRERLMDEVQKVGLA